MGMSGTGRTGFGMVFFEEISMESVIVDFSQTGDCAPTVKDVFCSKYLKSI